MIVKDKNTKKGRNYHIKTTIIDLLRHASGDQSPMTHLLPGMKAMTRAVTKQLMYVAAAMAGIAATVGRASAPLNMPTQNPSQNMCIR